MARIWREHYPVDDAAELLGCKVRDLYHMAGARRLSLYVDLHGHQADSAEVGISGEVSEPVAQRLNGHTRKLDPGSGINLRRTTSARGEVLDLWRLDHQAKLTIWGSQGTTKNQWQCAQISLSGFWQVAGAHFAWWERGDDTMGGAILRAYAMDGADSFIQVTDIALPPIQDSQFWVMSEDLRRLVEGEAASGAKAKSSRQPKSEVTDFIGELISLLPNLNDRAEATTGLDRIEGSENPSDEARSLALKLIAAIPALAGATKPTTIHNSIAALLKREPSIKDRTLRDWMKKTPKSGR